MTKTYTSKLSKKLAKYGALTAAIAGVADASGQIVYTDVTPDFVGTFGDEFFLDLNQDAINDFKFTGYAGSFSSIMSMDTLTAGNSVLGSNNYLVYPFALSSGAVISAGQTEWQDYQYQNLNSGYLNNCVVGNWCSETNKFLGLRFTIAGNTHYGWARMDADWSSGNFVVKDFAYNQTADESIMAGEGTLGLESSELNAAKIVVLNNTIGLYDLTEAVNYRLFDISGKEVLAGDIRAKTHTIDASGVSAGMYILVLNGIESQSFISKKVIL